MTHTHTHTYIHMKCWFLSCIQLFVTPWTVAHQAPLSWNSPGKNAGMSSHSFLKEILLTWGSNLCSLVWATRKAHIYIHKQVFTPCNVSVLQILSPYRLLQNTEYSSLCYTIGLSFIYTEVCVWVDLLCILLYFIIPCNVIVEKPIEVR